MAISTFAEIIAAIQAANASIEGVTSAPTEIPTALNTADLPLVLVDVGPFEANYHGSGCTLPRRETTYVIRCYARPVAQGEGLDQGYQEKLVLLQRFCEQYLEEQKGTSKFGGTIEQIVMPFNGNAYPVEFMGTTYQGFTIWLKVVEK